MYVDLAQAGVVIKKQQTVPIRSGPGTQILVLIGCAWVTQEGDARDHVLSSGEAMVVSKTGLVVITALEDSTVSVLQSGATNASLPEPHFPSGFPSGETLELFMVRAKQLRSEYIGHLASRLREKLGRAVSSWRRQIRSAFLESQLRSPQDRGHL